MVAQRLRRPLLAGLCFGLVAYKPQLAALYGWTNTGYGDVTGYFQVFYGIGFLLFGWLGRRAVGRWYDEGQGRR